VRVVLMGDKGTSEEILLESSADNFSKGKTDVFTVHSVDVGDLSRLRIGHNGEGNQPRWHCESVAVLNRTRKTGPFLFPCAQWFARDRGDGQCVRVLHVGRAAALAEAALKTRRYKVVVKTSDKRGAGTDANVYLTLHGAGGSTGPQALENSANNFEKGQTDVFEIEALNVSPLQFLRIGHDNSGIGASWHLSEVLVSSPGMPEAQFVADRWLATGEGDGQTYVTLYPTGAKLPTHKYRVHVRPPRRPAVAFGGGLRVAAGHSSRLSSPRPLSPPAARALLRSRASLLPCSHSPHPPPKTHHKPLKPPTNRLPNKRTKHKNTKTNRFSPATSRVRGRTPT